MPACPHPHPSQAAANAGAAAAAPKPSSYDFDLADDSDGAAASPLPAPKAKVQRMRPSPFHKGSGAAKPAAGAARPGSNLAPKPAVAAKAAPKGKAKKVVDSEEEEEVRGWGRCLVLTWGAGGRLAARRQAAPGWLLGPVLLHRQPTHPPPSLAHQPTPSTVPRRTLMRRR